MNTNELQTRYEALFGCEPTTPDNINGLEALLKLRLPDDMRAIATFYSGGVIGRKSLNAISPSGPASNIGEDTLKFRASANLPHSMIVLAELDESFIVLDTTPQPQRPAVYWCDNSDVFNLTDTATLHSPQTWESYAAFFESMLDDEEKARQ